LTNAALLVRGFFHKLRYLEARELNLDAEKAEVEKEEASRTQPSTEATRRPRIDCTRSKSTRLLATLEKVARDLKSGRAVWWSKQPNRRKNGGVVIKHMDMSHLWKWEGAGTPHTHTHKHNTHHPNPQLIRVHMSGDDIPVFIFLLGHILRANFLLSFMNNLKT
jgi:hypothetical protein